jgi:peptidyl-prolyl cis-trans isomerase SurA
MHSAILTLCVWFLICFPAHAVVLDRIVALVNDHVITLSELKNLQLSLIRSAPDTLSEEELKQNEDRLLDELIDKQIKLQKARRLRISVSEEEVDPAIQQILENNRMTQEELKTQVRSEGITWRDYRREIREQIIVSRLINQEVRSRILVMPEEPAAYYQKHLDRYALPEKKHLSRILLSIQESASADVMDPLRNLAEDIRTRALSGESFQQLALRFSNAPEASSGGDLGYFSEVELRDDLKKEVSRMGPGEISSVLEMEEGLVLLKVESVSEASHIPFEEVQKEIQEALYQEKLKTRYEAWIRELRSKAYIEKKL